MGFVEESVSMLLTQLDEVYANFLIAENVKDTPLTKLGFTAAALETVKGDPIEYSEVQDELVHQLEARYRNLLHENVEQLLKDFNP